MKESDKMNMKYKELYKVLGLKISYYRKLRGLTQQQLSDKLDIETSSLGAVESPNINRTISLDTLFKIAEILEIPAYKFLKDDD